MLTLHYNGYEIPTGLDFSIRMNWMNPLCFFDEIPGNSGLGIEIPVNEYSRAIFGNPGRFEKYTTTVSRKFPGFQLRYSGVLLLQGVLNITGASATTYSAWLQSEIGSVGEEQRDKFIPDLDWKTGNEFVSKATYKEGTDEYNPYPVLNSAFWNGKGMEIDVQVEYTDEDGEVHKVGDKISYLTHQFRKQPLDRTINQNASGSIEVTGEGCVVSPYLYLRYVIKQLLKFCHYYIDRNDMIPIGVEDTTLTKYLVLYNNFNIMNQEFTTQIIQYTEWNAENQENETREENKIIDNLVTWSLGLFDYKDLVPNVSLAEFLIGLQNYLNFVFVFRDLNKVDIIDRNEVLTNDPYDLDTWFLGEWVVSQQKDVRLKFTSEFDKEDRMFGQEFHDLTDRIKDFGDRVSTYDDLALIDNPNYGELRLVKDENKIYEYGWKVLTFEDILHYENQINALGWNFVSSGPQPFVYGDSDEVEQINTTFSTLQLKYHRSIFPRPVALQQGNIAKLRSLWAEFSPRLINTFESSYPAGLNWEGEYGIFNTRWKKWARFWKSRLPVEGQFNLPLNIIWYIKENMHTRPFRTREGSFIIESMETEFSSSMVGITTIKGYKL